MHFSVGFSLGDNQKLTDEMLGYINKEILNYYVPTHNIEDILHQSEAHLPTIQSIVNNSTGQLVSVSLVLKELNLFYIFALHK